MNNILAVSLFVLAVAVVIGSIAAKFDPEGEGNSILWGLLGLVMVSSFLVAVVTGIRIAVGGS